MSNIQRQIELMIRMSTLKDVEIWLNQQYAEIHDELSKINQERSGGDNE